VLGFWLPNAVEPPVSVLGLSGGGILGAIPLVALNNNKKSGQIANTPLPSRGFKK
jgi:hypothetical protein